MHIPCCLTSSWSVTLKGTAVLVKAWFADDLYRSLLGSLCIDLSPVYVLNVVLKKISHRLCGIGAAAIPKVKKTTISQRKNLDSNPSSRFPSVLLPSTDMPEATNPPSLVPLLYFAHIPVLSMWLYYPLSLKFLDSRTNDLLLFVPSLVFVNPRTYPARFLSSIHDITIHSAPKPQTWGLPYTHCPRLVRTVCHTGVKNGIGAPAPEFVSDDLAELPFVTVFWKFCLAFCADDYVVHNNIYVVSFLSNFLPFHSSSFSSIYFILLLLFLFYWVVQTSNTILKHAVVVIRDISLT